MYVGQKIDPCRPLQWYFLVFVLAIYFVFSFFDLQHYRPPVKQEETFSHKYTLIACSDVLVALSEKEL